MPPIKPQKPQPRRGAPTAYHQQPPDEANEGKLFRVRDKDWENLWGENLSFAEATKLKETVCGRGKSRTARVEDMTVPPPDWYQPATPAAAPEDPQLADARRKALAAARPAAAAAQARHDNYAARDRSSPAAAKRVAKPVLTVLPEVPVISTELPEIGDDVEDAIGDADVSDLMVGGDIPSSEDVARVKAKIATAPAPAAVKAPPATAELTAKAREIYRAEVDRKGGGAPWEKLHPSVQNHWRIEAMNMPAAPSVSPDDESPSSEQAAPTGDAAVDGVLAGTV